MATTLQEATYQCLRFVEENDPQAYANAFEQHFWFGWPKEDVTNEFARFKKQVQVMVYLAYQAGKNGSNLLDRPLLSEYAGGQIVGYLPSGVKPSSLYDFKDRDVRFTDRPRLQPYYIVETKNGLVLAK